MEHLDIAYQHLGVLADACVGEDRLQGLQYWQLWQQVKQIASG